MRKDDSNSLSEYQADFIPTVDCFFFFHPYVYFCQASFSIDEEDVVQAIYEAWISVTGSSFLSPEWVRSDTWDNPIRNSPKIVSYRAFSKRFLEQIMTTFDIQHAGEAWWKEETFIYHRH